MPLLLRTGRSLRFSGSFRGLASFKVETPWKLALLAGCSLASQTARAQLPPPPREVSADANGVDVRTGNLIFESPELSIGPEGEMGLHLNRMFSGGLSRDSFDSTYYAVNLASGQWSLSASFGGLGDSFGSFGTDVGAFSDSGYSPTTPARYQHRSGVIVTFGRFMWANANPYGEGSFDDYRLADLVTYPNGLRTRIHYKFVSGAMPFARIQSVTNSAGYQIKFRYASNDPAGAGWGTRVSAVAINMAAEYCDPEADDCALTLPWPTATYAYPTEGTTYVFSVTNAAGEVTTYRKSHVGSVDKFTIALPGSTAEVRKYTFNYLPSDCSHPFREPSFCTMGNDNRVVQFQNPEKTVTYGYNYHDWLFDEIISTDPGSIVNRYKSWGVTQLGMKSVTDPINRTQSFEYNAKGLITKATWPEGNYTEWQRDANGNVTQEKVHSKGNTQVLTQTQVFGACAMGVPTCALPVSVTDARLNTTNIIYNARGQKTAEIGPPDVNGVRPLSRWVYVDRYAYIKSQSGTLVQAEAPVSVLSKFIVCRSTFNGNLTDPACGSQADEVVTTYEYASTSRPNALLPIGKTVAADGELTRTCYGYDLRGNRIWETSPRANLASCE